jgi:hypothetical protein
MASGETGTDTCRIIAERAGAMPHTVARSVDRFANSYGDRHNMEIKQRL